MSTSKGVGLIPAREGSKGIPKKNLAHLAGKSLLQYAIESGQQSGALSRIVVSSDGADILDAAKTLGAAPLNRPAELATDNASCDSVIAHFIAAENLQAQPELAIVLLQPTSPLRTAMHVAAAMALWTARKPRCVVSVMEPREHPAKSFRLDEEGFMAGLFSPDAPFMPRQSLPRALMPNGAIYVFSVEAFLAEGRIPRTSMLPFVMDSKSSLDIDYPNDLIEAEKLLQGS